MSAPTTAAGQALLRYAQGLPPLFLTPAWEKGILAIEAEARAVALAKVEAEVRELRWDSETWDIQDVLDILRKP